MWNIVGRPIGGVAGFGYSNNMKSKGGEWGYEELDAFLAKPKKYIPKTKMAFNGLKKQEDRAALIEYLRLAADTPVVQLTHVVEEEVLVLETVVETVEDVVEEAVEPN
ncbi:cytochrome c family protein, partial [bacterium AH-315-J19]|nr:cytochrome c family protein [bacterium AH-315-J19]